MEDHDRIADQGEEEADRMEELSGELKGDIDSAREDWDAKKKTESVPGAIEPHEEDEEEERNEFEFEQRTPETADAKGPKAAEEPDSVSEDDDS